MGWSYSAIAGYVFGELQRQLPRATGDSSSNCFERNGIKRFWETSQHEHDDGSITGSIWKFLDNDRCRRVGSFKIDGDGHVVRFPGATRDNKLVAQQCGYIKYQERHGPSEMYADIAPPKCPPTALVML